MLWVAILRSINDEESVFRFFRFYPVTLSLSKGDS